MYKRIISLLLSFVMVFSLLPVGAYAEDSVSEDTTTEGKQTETTASPEEPSAQSDGIFGQEEFESAVVEKNGQLTEDIIITGDVVFDGGSLMIYADEGRRITIADGGSLTVSGGSFLTFNQNISVIVENGGKLVAEPGTFLIKMGTGDITVKSGATLTATGAADVFVDGMSSFTVESGATFAADYVRANLGATISGVDNAQIRMSNIAVSSTADLQAALATYSDYAGLEMYTADSFELTQNLVIPAGTFLSIGAPQTTVTVARGVTLVNEGEIWIYSEGTLVNNGTFENTGKLELQGGTFIDNSAEELPAFGQEEFNSAVVDKNGHLTEDIIITGDVVFDGGSLMIYADESRRITIADGGSLTVSGGSFLTFNQNISVIVENGGKLVAEPGTFLIKMGTGDITVKSGATLTATGAADVFVDGMSSFTVESGATFAADYVRANLGATISGVDNAQIRMSNIAVSSAADLQAALATYSDYAGMDIYTTGSFELTENLVIPAGTFLSIEAQITVTVARGVTLVNEGEIWIYSEGTLVNNGTFDNKGKLEVQEGGNYIDNSASDGGDELSKVLVQGSDGFYTLSSDVTITGESTYDKGTALLLMGTPALTKTITIAAGGKLTISGNSTLVAQNKGAIIVEDGGELIVEADNWLYAGDSGSITVNAGGTLTNEGTVTVQSGGTLVNSGTLSGNGILDVQDGGNYSDDTVTEVASGTCGENLTWVLTDDGVLTISGEGEMYDYNPFADDYAPWYAQMDSITSIVVEEGVTTIGFGAFAMMEQVKTVSYPASLEVLGAANSTGCYKIEEFIVAEGNKTYYTYEGAIINAVTGELFTVPMAKTGRFTVPAEVLRIGGCAFEGCIGITEIILNEGLKELGEAAFLECTSLNSMTIPASVEKLEPAVFHNSGVTEVTFCGDVPEFADNAFEEATATAYYPADNTTWTDEVKQNYGGNITWEAYQEDMQEPAEVASGTCGENLTWVLTDDGVLTISGEGEMYDYNPFADDYAPWYAQMDSITSIVVEEGVTTIGFGAFAMMEQVKTVSYPASLEVLGAANSTGCYKIEEFIVAEGNKTYYTYEGAIINAVTGELFTVPMAKTGRFTVPAEVLRIGGCAFEGCIGITEIILNEGLKELGEAAFLECTSLNSMTIPASVEKLEPAVFHNSGVTEVIFCGDAPAFADNAFEEATATAYYPADNTTWTDEVKQNYGGNITWEAYQEDNSVSSLDALKAAIDAGETNIVVSDSIICGPEDTLTIPENVTVEIPDSATLLLNGTVNIAGTVINHGTVWVNMNCVATVASSGSITNYGNIHVGFGDGEYSSTLNIAGEVVSYGYFNVTDHGTVNVTGTLSNQMNGPEAGFIDLKGKLMVTGTLKNQSGPSITVEGGTLDVSNGTYSGMFPVTVFLSNVSTAVSGINGNMLNYCYRVTDQDGLLAAIDAAETYGHINAEMNAGFTLTESVTLSNMMLTVYGMNGNPVELTVADGVTLTNNAEIRIGIDATLTVAEGGTLHNNRSITVANGTVNVAGSYTSDYEDTVISIDLSVGGTVNGAPYRVSGAAYDYNGLKNALALSESHGQTGVDITVENTMTITEDMEIPAHVTMYVSGNPYNNVTIVVPYGVTLTNHGNLEINCAELAVHSGGKLINNGGLVFNAMPHGFGGGSLGGELVNHGNLWVNTGSTVDIGGSATNYGEFHVGFGEGQTCTLNINGGLTSYGYLNVTEYGNVNASGVLNIPVDGDDSGFLQNGGTVNVPGTLNITGMCLVGNESKSAKLYVADNGVLNVTDTSMDISGGEVGIDGQLNAVNSSIINNGLLAINRNGEANIDENSSITNNDTLHVGMGPDDEDYQSILNVEGVLENYGYFCIHDKGFVNAAGEMKVFADEDCWGFMEIHGEVEVSGALVTNNQINVIGSLDITGSLDNDGTVEVNSGAMNVTGSYSGDGIVHMYCEYGQVAVTGIPKNCIEASFAYVTDAQTLISAMTSGYRMAHVMITGDIILSESLTIPAGSSLHIANFRTDAAVYARSLLAQNSDVASLTVLEGVSLTVEGNLSNEGNVIIEQAAELVNKKDGNIENSGSLIVEEAAEMVNEGNVNNVGTVVVESNAALVNNGSISTGSGTVLSVSGTYSGEGTVNANMMEDTVLEGIDNASLNVTDEVSGEEELREMLNSGYNGGTIYVSSAVVLTEDLTIPEGYMVYLTSEGSVTVSAGTRLTVSGQLQQMDNTDVTVEAGAALEITETGFWNVQSGTLTVAEGAEAVIKDNLAFVYGGGNVVGIEPAQLMMIAFAANAAEIDQAVADGVEYSFNYLYVSESVCLEHDLEIPENTTIVLSGMEENPVSLIVPENVTLTNNGTLEVQEYGLVTVENDGILVNNACITVNGGDIAVEEGGKLTGNAPEGIVIPEATIGDVGYETLAGALEAAQSGDSVKLLNDVIAADVVVRGGITLDLNGYNLAADYVFVVKGANIVDNSEDNTGLLKVDASRVMIGNTNSQLPVWNGEGYVFTTVTYRTRLVSHDNDSLKFAFLPQFKSGATALLEDGVKGNKVTIEVRVSWTTTMGQEYRNLVFNEYQVDLVVGTNGAFLLTFSGFSQLDMASGISVEGVVISETGVSIASEAIVVDVTQE